MDLSVITVAWNSCDKLRNNLTNLLASEGLTFEVFVVDNASSDGTADMVQNEFPQVNLIKNTANLGFAKANNQAIKLSTGDFVLLLNPDMEVDDKTLARAVAWLRAKPESLVTGFKLLDTKGQLIEQVRKFPTLLDQLFIVLKIPHFFPSLKERTIIADFDYDQESKVDSIRGSFFFIRRRAIEEIGLLDERFFIWFEEVDYCKRVHQAGGQVWYSPAVSAIDLIGQSFIQLPRTQAQKYFRDSQLKYFAKWHPIWQKQILSISWLISGILVWLGTRRKK